MNRQSAIAVPAGLAKPRPALRGNCAGARKNTNKDSNKTTLLMKHSLRLICLLACSQQAVAQYPEWKYSASIWVLTTPDGADLPASMIEKDFPLLVQLNEEFFDFAQAKADGRDIRFSTPAGDILKYQIEEWNAANGHAFIWVRLPIIRGNARQEMKLYWGKADAKSESWGRRCSMSPTATSASGT